MIKKKEEIADLGARVLLIAYDEPALLDAKMLFGLDNPFPILLDSEKKTYVAWGMGRTTLSKSMLSPTLTYRYMKLLLEGEKFLGFAPDMLQLGGDFIIDREMRISLAHRMKTNGDRADVERLLEELKRVARN